VVDQVEQSLAKKRLQGTWVPDLLVTKQGAEAYPLSGRLLSFDESQFARFEGRRCVAIGAFKIEDGFLRLEATERSPWDLEAGTPRDKTQYAFKVEGDLLTLCFSADNKGKAGDLLPGESRQVVVYKRQKPEVKKASG
jgi:hypothetical protein